MGIHVIQSQRIEVLVQAVLQSLPQASKNPLNVLKAQHFVVPNAAVKEWLIQQLAEKQGISANTFFHERLRGFQWYAYQQVLTHKDEVRKANIPRLIMKWRIFQTLKPYIDPETSQMPHEHALYSLIQRVYATAQDLTNFNDRQAQKYRMAYWVAEQLSKLFSHYMTYRAYCSSSSCGTECVCKSNWLQLWGRGEHLKVETLFSQKEVDVSPFQLAQAKELEQWQAWLWQSIFHQDFQKIEKIDAAFWADLADPEQGDQARRKLPKQITVFTLLDLAPSQLNFLRRLGQYIDILVFHYNPSQEYWADSVDPRWKKTYNVGVKQRFIEKKRKIDPDYEVKQPEIDAFFESFSRDFNADLRESRHPLLTRFGKQARDHFSLLANLSSGDEGQWLDLFDEDQDQSDSILHQLQSDILYLVEPKKGQYTLQPTDDSIQLHVCHSTQRQLEVLKEQMLHWLSQSHAKQPRKPSDILVLVPNLADAEPLIRSVFPHLPTDDLPYLPVKIAGVAQLDVELAWQAVRGRLDWVDSRFTLNQFADWLSLKATQQYYALDLKATERMIYLLAEAGFKRGFDDEHLKKSLSESDDDLRFSFKFALDRLSLGIAIPEHRLFEDTLAFAQVLSGDFELIGTLIQIYQDFDQRRHWWLEHEQPNALSVEKRLMRLNEDLALFEERNIESLKTVRMIIGKQLRMLTLASKDLDFGGDILRQMRLPLAYIFQEIEQNLATQIDQATPTGQITFSEIGQIRPLPYQLVVMLNLDSGKFPSRQQHIPFDLMDLLKPQLGDRSRLEDDQGAFLDAMLLARQNFWLFYNGFDVNDGELRDPSSVVQELVQHLEFIVKNEYQSHSELDQKIETTVQKTVDVPIAKYHLAGVPVPENLRSLYRVHSLQPFDVQKFQSHEDDLNQEIRYQDQWFAVAKQLQNAKNQLQGWAVEAYAPNRLNVAEMQTLESSQWMRKMSFPATLYLKTLGVENLKAIQETERFEPLLLTGLKSYAVRDFLQQQEHEQDLVSDLLLDQLPVGKLKEATWQQSMLENSQLNARLAELTQGAPVTQTTHRIWRVEENIMMNIQVPKSSTTLWASVTAASARGNRRVHVWLEYLLWMAYLNLGELDLGHQRVVVCRDATIICAGVSSEQAKVYLAAWMDAWRFGQRQPLVLPANLLLARKPKSLDVLALQNAKDSSSEENWLEHEQGQKTLKLFDKLVEEWEKEPFGESFDIRDNEANRAHRDWSFILQAQDATALLRLSCDRFTYVLYQPIYQYQCLVE